MFALLSLTRGAFSRTSLSSRDICVRGLDSWSKQFVERLNKPNLGRQCGILLQRDTI